MHPPKRFRGWNNSITGDDEKFAHNPTPSSNDHYGSICKTNSYTLLSGITGITIENETFFTISVFLSENYPCFTDAHWDGCDLFTGLTHTSFQSRKWVWGSCLSILGGGERVRGFWGWGYIILDGALGDEDIFLHQVDGKRGERRAWRRNVWYSIATHEGTLALNYLCLFHLKRKNLQTQ